MHPSLRFQSYWFGAPWWRPEAQSAQGSQGLLEGLSFVPGLGPGPERATPQGSNSFSRSIKPAGTSRPENATFSCLQPGGLRETLRTVREQIGRWTVAAPRVLRALARIVCALGRRPGPTPGPRAEARSLGDSWFLLAVEGTGQCNGLSGKISVELDLSDPVS